MMLLTGTAIQLPQPTAILNNQLQKQSDHLGIALFHTLLAQVSVKYHADAPYQ